jgi:hypothetical protein
MKPIPNTGLEGGGYTNLLGGDGPGSYFSLQVPLILTSAFYVLYSGASDGGPCRQELAVKSVNLGKALMNFS